MIGHAGLFGEEVFPLGFAHQVQGTLAKLLGRVALKVGESFVLGKPHELPVEQIAACVDHVLSECTVAGGCLQQVQFVVVTLKEIDGPPTVDGCLRGRGMRT